MKEAPEEWIPLLGKPLRQFTPEDFKIYIRGLYNKPAKKTKTIKLKKQKPPFSWSLTKKGNLSLKVNRTPKWLSREEIDQITKESGRPANEVFLKIKKMKIEVSKQEEQDLVVRTLSEIPW